MRLFVKELVDNDQSDEFKLRISSKRKHFAVTRYSSNGQVELTLHVRMEGIEKGERSQNITPAK